MCRECTDMGSPEAACGRNNRSDNWIFPGKMELENIAKIKSKMYFPLSALRIDHVDAIILHNQV